MVMMVIMPGNNAYSGIIVMVKMYKPFFFFLLNLFRLIYCHLYTLLNLKAVPRKNFDVFLDKISLPERRNKRKSVLEITKMCYF